LVWLTMMLNGTARFLQVVANFKQGHTGQLSSISLTLNFLGACARVFTTIVELKDDVNMLMSVCLSAFWNFLLFFQLVYYWKKTKEALSAKKKD